MGGYRVYIGRLARDAQRRDIESLFKDYGRILDVTVKTGFGFVEFQEKADADDAVHDMHDTRFLGQRIIVEHAMSPRRERRERDFDTNRIVVKNIPPKTTWQDLKDFCKKAGRVTFADILKDHDGEGRDDMEYALKELNDEKLNGSRVKLEEAGRRRKGRDRSRSPRRHSSRRSRTRSRSLHQQRNQNKKIVLVLVRAQYLALFQKNVVVAVVVRMTMRM
ncbi:hypothetical protein BDF20DRAFT_355340 [Mycotypha africana]|uniref:uncharacterized protein n=1 Tax=Mycotypha africana TaxID=64632 RepID=UPI0023014A2A|nr:uncharacterized protein BDF20DRAFT_355340 [Mycotypha africana]KAI8983943.1 hypothetical protein BDF20DRAFT_355340 [Mycotypha africana]